MINPSSLKSKKKTYYVYCHADLFMRSTALWFDKNKTTLSYVDENVATSDAT